jgi:catechol 2,3-dioxygenase-like lactoylglutathione lyase family enzyme
MPAPPEPRRQSTATAEGERPLAGATLVAFVGTTDLDRAHAFYGEILGLRRTAADGFASVYDVEGTSLRVTRVDRVATTPYTVLGWRVDDISGALARLASRGVAAKRFDALGQDGDGVWTAPGGARVAWFEDPDGNVLSLTEMPAGSPSPAGRPS